MFTVGLSKGHAYCTYYYSSTYLYLMCPTLGKHSLDVHYDLGKRSSNFVQLCPTLPI